MTADILLLALCFLCVLSNDEQHLENAYKDSDLCESHTLRAPIGSSVLLPCTFSTSSLDWVSWVHIPETYLVHLKSKGRVMFVEPRHGRVKAFPNQGSEGNYSICIDELKNSDLGRYHCVHGKNCVQVELIAEMGTLSTELWLILICLCAIAFILLLVSGYCCMKAKPCWRNRTQYSVNNPVGAVASAPSVGMSRVPRDEQSGVDNLIYVASAPSVGMSRVPRDEQSGVDNLIYENDDQGPANWQVDPTRNQCSLPGQMDRTQPTSSVYPTLNQFNSERMERRKQSFHRVLLTRLRQASLSRHYYVNQGDISRQQAMSTQMENHG